MRVMVIVLLVVLSTTNAFAQTLPSAFEDVPPWHWAFDAVQSLAQKGILQGYPRVDRDLALNAVTQVYDSFVHATHPAARGWAEAFLTNLPVDWPGPLERSKLMAFRLIESQVRLAGSRGSIAMTVVARIRLGGGGAAKIVQGDVTAAVVKDAAGRWRVDYRSLAGAQPEIFK